MRYIVECELNRFQAWSGGKTWLEEAGFLNEDHEWIEDTDGEEEDEND